MDLDSMYTPGQGPDLEGREGFAKFLRAQYKNGPTGNELARYFATGNLNKLPETGGELRKSSKSSQRARFSTVLRQVIETAREAGLVKASDLEATMRSKGPARVCSVEAIRKIHARGPGRLEKATGLPPQSSNAHWDDERADDGADLAHDATDAERQRSGTRPKPAQMAPPHSASIRVGRPPPEDEDVTVVAIKEAHRNPRPLWG